MTIAGKRYDYPGLPAEFIARERARKRLANKRAWVEKWWSRIAAEVEAERKADDDR